MPVKLVQGKKKDGSFYYTFKADQQCGLSIADGRYIADKTTLLVSLKEDEPGDIEVIRWENKKPVAPEPFEFPVTVAIKIDKDNGTVQEKAIHALFTRSQHKELASGFAGHIAYAESMQVKRCAVGTEKESDYDTFAEIVAIESKLDANLASTSIGMYGGAKGQTQAEIIADRVAYLQKVAGAESPEKAVLDEIEKSLKIDLYAILTLLLH